MQCTLSDARLTFNRPAAAVVEAELQIYGHSGVIKVRQIDAEGTCPTNSLLNYLYLRIGIIARVDKKSW